VDSIKIKTQSELPIPARAVRELYDHVGWSRPVSEKDLAEVLEVGWRSGPGTAKGS
jgi:hypothetical protein